MFPKQTVNVSETWNFPKQTVKVSEANRESFRSKPWKFPKQTSTVEDDFVVMGHVEMPVYVDILDGVFCL